MPPVQRRQEVGRQQSCGIPRLSCTCVVVVLCDVDGDMVIGREHGMKTPEAEGDGDIPME